MPPTDPDTTVEGPPADVSVVALRAAYQLGLDFLASEREMPVRAYQDPERLRSELGIALGEKGCHLATVYAKLYRILAATPTSGSRRFFNQLFGGRDPAATTAELLTALPNVSMYTYKVAGPQVLVEQEVLRRMASKVGYEGGDGLFMPGGSLSNMTAMLIARNETVAAARDAGLDGRRLTVYTSVDGHYSVPKSAAILGLGRRQARMVPVDAEGGMDVEALQRMIAEDRDGGALPVMINATAGTTVVGAFDGIDRIADVAREHGIWLHVDGALGGTVLLCEDYRHLLRGAERSDSFAWNAHKMMGVPLVCSVLLVRRPEVLVRHLGESADYLFQADRDELNPGARSLQCGRRNDALKLWAAWQYHGDAGYAERVRRQFALARRAVEMIAADPELELIRRPQSVTVCFAVRGKSSAEICDRLHREGRIMVGYGTVDERQAIRLVCINPELTDEDLEVFFREVKTVAAALPATGGG